MKKLIVVAFAAIMLFPLFTIASINGDTVEVTVQGKISYKSGTVVKMEKLSGDEMPPLNMEGELSKSFETELFGGKMTGWMSIGKMKVTAVVGNIITFTLLKELSEITENGVKKNQFEIGKEVKFVWKVVVSSDEVAYRNGQDAIEDDMDQALTYYRQAVSINPKHDKALNMIGMIMNNKTMLDSALIYFKKAYDANPKNVQYAKNVCITSYKNGLTQDAITYSQKAVDIDNADAESYYLRALMAYLVNKAILQDADKQKILADMDKAIEYATDKAYYYSERAFIRKDFGNTTGACEDAKKAKELGIENGDDLIKQYCGE
jgi:hypothetical protein